MADVSLIQDGGMFGFAVHTKAAKEWFAEYVQSEGWQWLGDVLYLDDGRLADDLLVGIEAAGLKVS